MRMLKETENTGDVLSKIFKIIPSYALSDAVLYSVSSELLNKTRNYTEGDILKAKRDEVELPQRVNITRESWDLANMGGDVIALAAESTICLALLIAIETGFFVWLASKCRTQ